MAGKSRNKIIVGGETGCDEKEEVWVIHMLFKIDYRSSVIANSFLGRLYFICFYFSLQQFRGGERFIT